MSSKVENNKNFVTRREVLAKISNFAVFCVLFSKVSPSIAFAAGTSRNGGKGKNNLKAFRLGKQNGKLIRFVIESSDKIKYTYSFIKNPNRMVINIENANFNNLDDTTVKTGFVNKTRYIVDAQNNKNIKIILDLSDNAAIQKDFAIPPSADKGHRLVFDLKLAEKEAVEGDTNKPVVKEKRTYTVVIDAGHGGKDPGAIGRKRTREKDIVLLLAKNIRNQLKKEKNFKVIMTRDSDKFIKLKDRARVSDKNKADLFLSIHADSNRNKKARGLSVYTLSDKASDEEARRLAEKENAADLIGDNHFEEYDPVVKNILGELNQTIVKETSMEFADAIVREVKRNRNIKLLSKPHRQAPFAVLKSSVPSVLIEAGFLSNSKEESLLNKLWYRTEVAGSIKNAIKKQLVG